MLLYNKKLKMYVGLFKLENNIKMYNAARK